MSRRAWWLACVGLIGALFALAVDTTGPLAEDQAAAQLLAQADEPTDKSKKRKKDKDEDNGGDDLSGLLSSMRPLSDKEEAAIGRRIAGNLLGAAPLVKDAKLQAYVNRVGRWVAAQSKRPDLKWTFAVVDSADVNAWAAPGGYVLVTRGLYARLQDEAQLAGVLGHEIAHVQEKHHLKVLQKQQLMGAGGNLLTQQLEGETVQRIIGSGAEILARGLDKQAEYEADRIGVVLAARAGYDPYGLPAVLQDIGSIAAASDTVSLLFKTHPHPDVRLAELGEAMGARLDSVPGKALPQRLYRLR
jgi:predicted Zn-dependent protease